MTKEDGLQLKSWIYNGKSVDKFEHLVLLEYADGGGSIYDSEKDGVVWFSMFCKARNLFDLLKNNDAVMVSL